MKQSKHISVTIDRCRIVRYFFGIALLVSIFIFSNNGFADEKIPDPTKLIVILNHDVTADKLTENQIKAIFALQRLSWNDGVPIQIVMFPSTHEFHAQFTKSILGIMPFQLERAWARMKFKGLMRPPAVVNSVDEMIAVVGQTPGAIGYINEHELTAAQSKIKGATR